MLTFPYELDPDGDIDFDMMGEWELTIDKLAEDFNAASTHINVWVFSAGGL